jgi:putative FmdB family regulatory protein
MPIYEYRCSECGHELEALQKLADAPLSTCPACGKEALRKLVSAAGFQLKGSGWYVTDFRGGGAGARKAEADKGEKTDKADKADTPASDTAKSEAKADAPAAKDTPAAPKPASTPTSSDS